MSGAGCPHARRDKRDCREKSWGSRVDILRILFRAGHAGNCFARLWIHATTANSSATTRGTTCEKNDQYYWRPHSFYAVENQRAGSVPRITPVHWKVLECIFIKTGFTLARHKGTSHRHYTKNGILRPIVIPIYPEIDSLIIKNNMRTAGISRAEYFRLLKLCK